MARPRWCPLCKSILREGTKPQDKCDKHKHVTLELVPHDVLEKERRKNNKRKSLLHFNEGTAHIPDAAHAYYSAGSGGGKVNRARLAV